LGLKWVHNQDQLILPLLEQILSGHNCWVLHFKYDFNFNLYTCVQ